MIRGAAGSAIAPPYLSLLSRLDGSPEFSSNTPNQVVVTQNNPNLVPETAFGYDLGADLRVKNSYYLSGDLYLTNLYNQFIQETIPTSQTCTSVTFPTSGCPATNGPQIFYSIYNNLNNARYEGIELSLKHVVDKGFGFSIAGSTQRGYAYNLGADFYCSEPNTAATPCTPATYNQNLAVIPNVNFNGGAPGSTYLGSSTACPTGKGGATPGSNAYFCLAGNNVSNQAVPYLQGYAEINWHNPAGWYASFGETLFGKNNSYGEPPFTVARFSIRAPISDTLSVQVSGRNIFNAYSGLFPIVGGGVPVPLANGQLAATNGNVLGPAVYNFVLTKRFGSFSDSNGRDGNSSR